MYIDVYVLGLDLELIVHEEADSIRDFDDVDNEKTDEETESEDESTESDVEDNLSSFDDLWNDD